MIEEYPTEEGTKLLPFFTNYPYLKLLVEAILKEKNGTILVDKREKPSVILVKRKVLQFVNGDSTSKEAEALIKHLEPNRLIIVPDKEWGEKLKEKWKEQLHTKIRTKFSSTELTRGCMQEIVKQLPDGLGIELLTKETIGTISEQASFIIHILFSSLEDFLTRSFGFCIKDGGNIVSVALAASPTYGKDYEIHIETDPGYQRRGLAMINSAKLIDYSLEKGLIPHWDADNEPSAKLAKKLKFIKPEHYETYFWSDKNEK